MFIINAPFMFRGVWTIVKAFIHERTKAKIKILGSKYHKEVFEAVDPSQLPKFLGGECDCDGGCQYSDMGPH